MTHQQDKPNHTDDGPAPDREGGPGAEIVHLDAARTGRHPHKDTDRSEPNPVDDSAATTVPVLEGEVVRVDQPGDADRDWRAELAEKSRSRRPIVPLWLRSRREAVETLKWATGYSAYLAGYQLSRTPLYAGRLTVRSPRGLIRLVAGTVRWTLDLEGEPVRIASVQKSDHEAYLKLSRQRDSRVRLRVWVAGIALVTLLIVGIIIANAPTAAQWTALAVAIAVLGVIGKPADRPLIDRAVLPTRVEKLTSDIVVRALTVLGVSGLNAKADINFVAPITRDGPGWRADLDLPHGVTVADILDKRPRLASGLRRPLGCIWPEGDPSIHEGRLIL